MTFMETWIHIDTVPSGNYGTSWKSNDTYFSGRDWARKIFTAVYYRGRHTRAPTGLIMESTIIRSKLDLKNKPQ